MKNILIAITLALFLLACNKDNEKETLSAPLNYFENRIDLKIEDQEGMDLLNSENPGNYQNSDIIILDSDDLENAVSILKYSQETDFYYLNLALNYPNPDINKDKSYHEEHITKVIFNNNEVDEIKGLFEIEYHLGSNEEGYGTGSGYTVTLKEAWFNNKQIFKKVIGECTMNKQLPIVIKEHNN